MILPVYTYGNQVLRKKAKDIDKNFENLDTFINNMYDTMYQSDGVGLAAPQIGKSIRLFVIDASPMAEENSELLNFKKVFINAKIIHEEGEEWSFNEGCLSLLGIREDVKRKPKIIIEYLDENFNFHQDTFDGIIARIIQHEYDHLEGILFVDRLGPLKKRLLKSKLNNIIAGKVKISYKIMLPKK